MSRLISFLIFCILVSLRTSAMESHDGRYYKRSELDIAPVKDNCTSQKNGIVKFIFCHTCTGTNNSISIIKAIQKDHQEKHKFADIAYNFCFDINGNCYECRSIKHEPAICKDNNSGTCGIGIIGTYHLDDSPDIPKSTIKAWGKHLGNIAFDCGIKKLDYKKNVFGISEIDAKKYPESPGIKVLAVLKDVVEIANETLSRLQ